MEETWRGISANPSYEVAVAHALAQTGALTG
jgi:hypothetical protein